MDVSVILDNGRPWSEIRELALIAEELGVHAVYVCDHFMEDRKDGTTDDSPFLECGTLLAGLAEATSRARLGALVMGSTYRHPAVVANMVATIDHISGGRAIAGLGAGWQVNEHLAYGIDLLPPGDLSDRFEETVAVVSSLLREERTNFDGRFFRLTDAPNKPAPVQDRLPILVAGGGEKRTLPTAARYADVWHVWGKPDGFAAKSTKLDEACRAIGRDPAGIRRATGFPTPVGSDIREELEPYREVCDEFVVFDWTDRPMKSTVDDLTAALSEGAA
jgi:alkanesulfonate monooxygenase SsuD/methylene tetrahydromethanopterin reductase-like flavin-dependent oxidoreductase (luciferase family)